MPKQVFFVILRLKEYSFYEYFKPDYYKYDSAKVTGFSRQLCARSFADNNTCKTDGKRQYRDYSGT
jgi:hypothetical protein